MFCKFILTCKKIVPFSCLNFLDSGTGWGTRQRHQQKLCLLRIYLPESAAFRWINPLSSYSCSKTVSNVLVFEDRAVRCLCNDSTSSLYSAEPATFCLTNCKRYDNHMTICWIFRPLSGQKYSTHLITCQQRALLATWPCSSRSKSTMLRASFSLWHTACSRHVTTQWPQHALHATPRKHQCQSPENAVRLKVWHHHHISYTRCEPSCVSTSVQICSNSSAACLTCQKILNIDTNEHTWIQMAGTAMAGRKAPVP